MSGLVKVIIKDEMKNQISYIIKTSQIEHYIKTPFFNYKDSSQLKETLSKIQEANQEELNKKTLLTPFHYGIISIDYENKKVMSMQEYCSISKLFKYDFYSTRNKIWIEELTPSSIDSILNLKNLGVLDIIYIVDNSFLLINYEDRDENGNEIQLEKINISHLDKNEIISLIEQIKYQSNEKITKELKNKILDFDFENKFLFNSFFDINNNNLNWKFSDHLSYELPKVKQTLINDGWNFTKEEDDLWNRFNYR